MSWINKLFPKKMTDQELADSLKSMVYVDGLPAPDGDYCCSDGSVLIVKDGQVVNHGCKIVTGISRDCK